MDNAIAEQNSEALDFLLGKVYRESGYDFRYYKRGTIMRRLARRFYATGASNYQDYSRLLDAFPAEYHNLAEDLTIKVSGFFRNPYTFQKVKEIVLPELLAGKQARGEKHIRFWSAACARGEEPYSLTILLSEFLDAQWKDFEVTVFATDVSRSALEQAKNGLYRAAELELLPANLREKYFVTRGLSYEVQAHIRQNVRFGHYDLNSTAETPFDNIDLIFCCNVLIYLQKLLQEKIFEMLHVALADGGYLVLGDAESPTPNMSGRLECLDAKAKIYRKVSYS
ncbi:MAG: protein-glutamate O-methyltransferase CheR [Dehalococcoidales bacterium]|nr:protein-glutamate O-methyltransferase CheR [Dehalococcoidales bacterium]